MMARGEGPWESRRVSPKGPPHETREEEMRKRDRKGKRPQKRKARDKKRGRRDD